MPDWLSGVASIVAALGALWAIIRGRRKENAETNGLLVGSYKSLVNDLREESRSKDQVIRMKDEKIQNLEAQLDVEHDGRVHAETFLTIATAKIAAYEGRKLTNSEAENDDTIQTD